MPDSSYVIAPADRVAIPVLASSALFPVRRIYCAGRNYLEHIREVGGDERELPFFFQKPADAIVLDGSTVPYPTITSDFQHEVELVMAIGNSGREIPVASAHEYVFGLAIGIDLTRRDFQVAARKAGRPWEIGKSFDHSAAIGLLHPTNGSPLPTRGEISLAVNGQVRQTDDLSQMIWSCSEIISELSRQYQLAPGDLIYTGTPAGVGPLSVGDLIEARFEALTPLSITIGKLQS